MAAINDLRRPSSNFNNAADSLGQIILQVEGQYTFYKNYGPQLTFSGFPRLVLEVSLALCSPSFPLADLFCLSLFLAAVFAIFITFIVCIGVITTIAMSVEGLDRVADSSTMRRNCN